MKTAARVSHSLAQGVSAAAIAIMLASAPAHAQDAAVTGAATGSAADQTTISSTTGGAGQQATDATEGKPIAEQKSGEIVVTGIRASLQGATQRKRNAEQVIESITAQDIGALPDRSVAEALQRVPGVTLERTSDNRDPARLNSEGGSVQIRGLTFVRSELNGRDTFSANNGRALSFDDVSADLLSGVDIYKNPSAELVEGGIGGSINLRTRKPFDANGRVVAFSGDATYNDLLKRTKWSGSLLASDRWHTGIGEIGILLSYSINNSANRSDQLSDGKFVAATLAQPQDGLAAGTTVYLPSGMGFRRVDWQQKRQAFDGSIQWKPSDTLTITGEAFLTKATPHDLERAVADYSTPEADNSTYVFGDQNQLVSGVVNNRQLELDTRSGYQKNQTRDFSGNIRWVPNEHWAFGADVQYVKSTAKVVSLTAFTQTSTPTTFDFDLGGNTPRMVITPTTGAASQLTDQSLYWWAAAMDHIEDNEAHEWAYRGDAEYTFDEGSFLKSFRLGIRGTDREAITRQTGYNWSLLSAQYGSGYNPVYLNQTGFDAAHQSAGLPSQSALFNFKDYFRGSVAAGGAYWFPAASLVQNGTANAYSYLKNTESSGWGWTPLTGDYASATPGADNVSAGINNQSEKTYAGYALLRFGENSGAIGHFDGNIGVRVVRTDTGADGSPTRITAPTSSPAACVVGTPITTGSRNGQTVTAADCATYQSAFTFASGTIEATDSRAKGSYTDILPSINLRYFIQDNLQLRAAAAKAIVRPTFAQLNPFTTLGFSFDSTTSIANGVGAGGRTTAFTGTAGNPNLKPTRANQFDLSLEYYFGKNKANSLVIGGFYKLLKDYIFAGVDEENYTSNGQTITFDVTRQQNGSHGTIRGFEAAYTQLFDMLPGALGGLGFQGNFTFVDSSGGKNTAVNVFDANQTTNAGSSLPLEGLSKYSYNVAGIYEHYGISARIAYNWRSTYLLTTSAANINYPVWWEGYGQLDGSIFYALNKHLKVGVQATNLLNTRTYLDVGDRNLRPRYSWTDIDRKFAFLVRGQF